jgi:hypothetical protein
VAIIVEFPVEAFGAAEKRTGALELVAILNGLTGFETEFVEKPIEKSGCGGGGGGGV